LENANVAEGSEGDSDDEDDADADQFDEDRNVGIRSDSPYSEPHPPPTTQMPRRSHPLQTAAVDPNSDSDASLLLSSPVFRRTVGTDDEDIGSDHVKKRGYRYGYRYGYGHLGGVEIEIGKNGQEGSDGHGKREDAGMEKLPARERNTSTKLKKDKTQREKESHERRLGGDEEAGLYAERKKVKERAEWIVLDMGTDLCMFSCFHLVSFH
jgi:hypothetical protein